VAVILPGTASTADFVQRAFGPALAAFGIGLVSDDPPRDGDVAGQCAALAEAVERHRPVLVGGVSIGAHLAARWAASGTGTHRPEGLLLAMPAWTGPPGPVAAASTATAGEVERDGIAAVLQRIRAAAWPDARWVADELATAWPAYRAEDLAATLRGTAASAGPSAAELATLTVPCGVAVLADDPLHPAAVGREWAAAAPRAAVVETRLAAVGADRATLGRAALLAWLRARA
jgi:pimeloyl-ACP methyl ester carboxylesterase